LTQASKTTVGAATSPPARIMATAASRSAIMLWIGRRSGVASTASSFHNAG
jgi:hypothetical protein